MALIEKKGCTFFPDRGLNTGGATCCDEHDKGYKEQTAPRFEIDCNLLACGAAAKHPWRAIAAFIGARLLGWMVWYWIAWKARRAAGNA